MEGKQEAAGDLRVFCGTWNVGNKRPGIIDEFVPRNGGEMDVIAVGFQEAKYDDKKIKLVGSTVHTVSVTVKSARGLKIMKLVGKQSPFATIMIGKDTHKTKASKKTHDKGSWNTTFKFPALTSEELLKQGLRGRVDIKALTGSTLVGGFRVPLLTFGDGQAHQLFLPLTVADSSTPRGELEVAVQIEPALPGYGTAAAAAAAADGESKAAADAVPPPAPAAAAAAPAPPAADSTAAAAAAGATHERRGSTTYVKPQYRILAPKRGGGAAAARLAKGLAQRGSSGSAEAREVVVSESDDAPVKMLQTQLGADYVMVECQRLMEMRLAVFVHQRHVAAVTEVRSEQEATGIGSVVGNKGGLVIGFCINATRLAFVSCHLAAHQAEKFKLGRNANCRDIITDAALGVAAVDYEYHHVFWMGDLNYRIDLPLSEAEATAAAAAEAAAVAGGGGGGGALERDHDTHWDAVKALVEAEEWDTLYAADQLQQEIAAGRVLHGFSEPPPQFVPTFKVERKPGTHHIRQRVPSWCDRVLRKSMPAYEQHVQRLRYDSIPAVASSDHKPVVALFSVATPPPLPLTDWVPGVTPQLRFNALKAAVVAADPNGLSDPFLVFLADPQALFHAKPSHAPFTDVISETLFPDFINGGNGVHVPRLRPRVADLSLLRRCHLIISAYDRDRTSANDPLGDALLPLSDLLDAEDGTLTFSVPLTIGGVIAGKVEGQLQILRPGDDGYEAAVPARDNKKPKI